MATENQIKAIGVKCYEFAHWINEFGSWLLDNVKDSEFISITDIKRDLNGHFYEVAEFIEYIQNQKE